MGEAHLPTEQPPSGEEARVSRPDEHPGWPRHSEGAAGQGPSPAVGLIAALRGRGDFERLRAEGRRRAAGPVWCVHRPDAAQVPPRIAFAIGRSVGTAVVRNRLRRRLREILRGIPLAPGDYLVGVSPRARDMSYEELGAAMTSVVPSIRSRSGS